MTSSPTVPQTTRSPKLRLIATPLARGEDIQIGLDPETGIVLAGLSSGEKRLLDHVDGSRDLLTLRDVGVRLGVTRDRLERLVGVLTESGILREIRLPEGATPLKRRRVVVDGDGRLAVVIARSLRENGLTDLAVGSGTAWVSDHTLRERHDARPPDVIVFVAYGGLAPDAGIPWRRRGIPHLPVVATDRRIDVGPLIQTEGPCLGCLDYYRTDRDPAWPQLLAQLTPLPGRPPPPFDVDAGTASITAGVVARLVGRHLSGETPPPGVAWEVPSGLPNVVRRRWSPHARCGCQTLTWDDAASGGDSVAAVSPTPDEGGEWWRD